MQRRSEWHANKRISTSSQHDGGESWRSAHNTDPAYRPLPILPHWQALRVCKRSASAFALIRHVMCRATLFAISFYLILACIGSNFVVCGLLDRGLLTRSCLSRAAEVDHGDVPRLPNFQECLSALCHALVPHLPASLAATVQSLL